MTSVLFEEWLRNFDGVMQEQNHAILLVIDNCLAHPNVSDLKNVTLVFSTSEHYCARIQPLDTGIIKIWNIITIKALTKKFWGWYWL